MQIHIGPFKGLREALLYVGRLKIHSDSIGYIEALKGLYKST